MTGLIQWADIIAVAVFAISGALAFALRASAILFDLRLPKYGR